MNRRMRKLPHEMIKSQAWRALSGDAVKIYIRLLFEVKNDRIQYTFLQAHMDYGIDPDVFKKSIAQLSDLGFIDFLSSRKFNTPNIYALSERWRLYGIDT